MRRSRSIVEDVECEVFGEACGSDGYLGVAEAQRLARSLRVGPRSLVLDLGAGRGWPGRRVAEITGCRIVFSDLPRDELADALARTRGSTLGQRCSAVVADGVALPFKSGAFDAIVHADVMC